MITIYCSMASTNHIGDRGESIFKSRLSENDYFMIYFLGEKAPIVDYLIEINDKQYPYYFAVQVKSTKSGYEKNGNLKASISRTNYLDLIKRSLPTYLAGVDVNDEIVYICPAFKPNSHYSTIPTNHKLCFNDKNATLATLNLLKQDVINFYDGLRFDNYKTNFKSLL